MKIFDYFLKNFSIFYELPENTISYGEEKNAKIVIKKQPDTNFFTNGNFVTDFTYKTWKNKKIPFLFAKDSKDEIITKQNGKIFINYDIVASAFYILSGYSELVSGKKDSLNRFKYRSSLIEKLNIIDLPVVNYYYDILYTALKEIDKKIKPKKIWEEYDFAAFLSHDIDVCKSGWLEDGKFLLKKRNLIGFSKLLLKKISGKDNWFNFNEIIDLEKTYQAKSTFFFLAKKGKTANLKNADYEITEPKMRQVLNFIKDKGFEIAIHGSFGTSINEKKFKTELDKMNFKVSGNRFHFLMFDNLKTPSVLAKNNMEYDSTLGFAEHIGFRRGTCYPFYLYDFANNKITNVLEIPLIVMDATLKYEKYMNLSPENALYKIKPIIEEVKKFNGIFSILWHNTFFTSFKYAGWKNVYVRILKYLKNENAMLTNGKTIVRKIKR